MVSSGCELKDKNNNSLYGTPSQETPSVFTQNQLNKLWARNLNATDNYPYSGNFNNLKKLVIDTSLGFTIEYKKNKTPEDKYVKEEFYFDKAISPTRALYSVLHYTSESSTYGPTDEILEIKSIDTTYFSEEVTRKEADSQNSQPAPFLVRGFRKDV